MITAKGTEVVVQGMDSQIYHELNLVMREWYKVMRDRGSGELGVKGVLRQVLESAMYQIEEDYQDEKAKKKGLNP